MNTLAGAQAPDIIYFHGHLATMDRSRPAAEAIATRGDRIVAVGSDAEVLALAGPNTARVDLQKHFVMPGFNDAHVHLAMGGAAALSVQMEGCRSLAEMQARIREAAAHTPDGEWLTGRGWDHTLWPEARFPNRHDLDAVTGNHPAFFARTDGHVAVVNTLALEMARITAASTASEGGSIALDAHGQPSGLLLEGAMGLVQSRIPPPSPAKRRQALSLALDDALRHGITSLQDNSSWEDFLALEALEREGKLPVRVSEWLSFAAPLATLEAQRRHHAADDPWLRTGMLKGFLDGSLGSRTAALLAPYADDPGNTGLPQYEMAQLDALARERSAAGFQLGFHAIGDRAVRMALDAFASLPAPKGEGRKGGMDPSEMVGPRHRIEHLQVIAPEDVLRLHALGVIASVQPNHLLTDMRWAEARLGSGRARYSYLWASLLRHGVPLAFGTDYPVESISPFPGLYAAITRQSLDQRQTYYPAERLSREQALHAYTLGSAMAEFSETQKGSLAPGKLADFVVLSQDLRTVAPIAIPHTTVLMTIVGGVVRYRAASQ